MPVRRVAKPRPHAHMLGQQGEPPCPQGTTYAGSIMIGGVKYCCYVDEGGLCFGVQC